MHAREADNTEAISQTGGAGGRRRSRKRACLASRWSSIVKSGEAGGWMALMVGETVTGAHQMTTHASSGALCPEKPPESLDPPVHR